MVPEEDPAHLSDSAPAAHAETGLDANLDIHLHDDNNNNNNIIDTDNNNMGNSTSTGSSTTSVPPSDGVVEPGVDKEEVPSKTIEQETERPPPEEDEGASATVPVPAEPEEPSLLAVSAAITTRDADLATLEVEETTWREGRQEGQMALLDAIIATTTTQGAARGKDTEPSAASVVDNSTAGEEKEVATPTDPAESVEACSARDPVDAATSMEASAAQNHANADPVKSGSTNNNPAEEKDRPAAAAAAAAAEDDANDDANDGDRMMIVTKADDEDDDDRMVTEEEDEQQNELVPPSSNAKAPPPEVTTPGDRSTQDPHSEEEEEDAFMLLSSIPHRDTGTITTAPRVNNKKKIQAKMQLPAKISFSTTAASQDKKEDQVFTMDLDQEDEVGEAQEVGRPPRYQRPLSLAWDRNGAKPGVPANQDAFHKEEEEEELFDEKEFEQALLFYQETHEEQHPEYRQWQERVQQQALRQQLQRLEEESQRGQREIQAVLEEQIKEKQRQAELNVERNKLRSIEEEKRDLLRLQQEVQQKNAQHQKKVADTMKELQRRQQKDLQDALQRHRQQSSQRGWSESQAAAEWQNMSQKVEAQHHRQRQELAAKGEERQKKIKSEYLMAEAKIRKGYEAARKEYELNKQKAVEKLNIWFHQLYQRYIKRHLQKMMLKREELWKNALARRPELLGSSSSLLSISGDSMRGSQHEKDSDSKAPSHHVNISSSPRDTTKSLKMVEEKEELLQVSPIKSVVDESVLGAAGASTRHKHRKGVLSQSDRHLTVEIHNEGIWIMVHNLSRPDDDENNTTTGNTGGKEGLSRSDSKSESAAAATATEREFVPWSVAAYTFLEAIVCGEIPADYFDRFDGIESVTNQGGQIRCTLADLRTSEETASQQRAQALREQEESNIAELEDKTNKYVAMAAEAEKEVTRLEAEEKERLVGLELATKEVEKAKRLQDEFTNKIRKYLGPDGNPMPTQNPDERQDLMKAMMRYKTNLETTTRHEKVMRQESSDAKGRLVAAQSKFKTGQKNAAIASALLKKKKALPIVAKVGRTAKLTRQSEAADIERAATRVKDLLAALGRAADRRRDQTNQKKSSSFSTAWVQSFPGLPSALKKSLWHRMHRRKNPIILRPSQESMIIELRSAVEDAFGSKQAVRPHQKQTVLEEEALKAEQLFLLATHPVAEDGISPVPPTKSSESWAEPGWQVNLSVPKDDRLRGCILPIPVSYLVLESNLSEIASAPGRQAASLLRVSHFRCLESPLTTFSIASSPAETTTSLSSIRSYTDGDPLFQTDEATATGYKFSLKIASSRPSAPSRKKPLKDKSSTEGGAENDAPQAKVSTVDTILPTPSASVPPPGMPPELAPTPVVNEIRKSDSKKRRSSKSASPRAQRRKSDPTAPHTDSSIHQSPRSRKAPVTTDTQAAVVQAAAAAHFTSFMQKQQVPHALKPATPSPGQSLPHPPSQQSQQHLHSQSSQQSQQPTHHHRHPQLIPQQQVQPQNPPQQHMHPSQFASRQFAPLGIMPQPQQSPPPPPPSPRHQQMAGNYTQPMPPMQQFYSPLSHPTSQGGARIAPMQMQGRQANTGPSSHHHHPSQQSSSIMSASAPPGMPGHVSLQQQPHQAGLSSQVGMPNPGGMQGGQSSSSSAHGSK